jgi:hypothetical protein
MVWLGGSRGFGHSKENAPARKSTRHDAPARKPEQGPVEAAVDVVAVDAAAVDEAPVDEAPFEAPDPLVACPKCKTAMEGGHAVTYAPGSAVGVAFWLRGPLEFTRWWGRLNLEGRKGSPMQVYRCPSCCYVEIYAK